MLQEQVLIIAELFTILMGRAPIWVVCAGDEQYEDAFEFLSSLSISSISAFTISGSSSSSSIKASSICSRFGNIFTRGLGI